MNRLFSLLIAALLIALPECKATETVLKGKVIDQAGKPVTDAQIILKEKETDKVHEEFSDHDGEFAIWYESSPALTLTVLPPAKSRLTCTRMNNVVGLESKHMIVQMRNGFVVTGRIIAVDRNRKVGLKGIVVNVMPKNIQVKDEGVHGGGITITHRDGTFRLVLTPGEKILELTNRDYKDVVKNMNHKITITSDAELPDIVMPITHEEGKK